MSSKIDAKLQELLDSNKDFAKTWHNPMMMKDIRIGAKQSQSAGLVLTCLDPRCVPEQVFPIQTKLGLGSIRNAGGRATPDVIRSIVALRTLADIRVVFVMHHTDCGMSHMTDAEIVADAKERTPEGAAMVDELAAAQGGYKGGFGAFGGEDFEEVIRRDVEVLRGESVLEGVEIRGLGFDVEEGVVRVVV